MAEDLEQSRDSVAWPPFMKENLTLGSMDSNVGICTMWTRRDLVEKIAANGSYAVIGNLYTVQGINTMIKNILANPKIRYIILFGDDRTGSGTALQRLIEAGTANDGRIPGSEGFIDESIPPASLEEFRNGVKVVDLRAEVARPSDDSKRSLNATIGRLDKLPPFAKPVLLKEERGISNSLDSDKVGYLIDTSSIFDAWLSLLDNIMKFGVITDTAYGMRQKEILDAMVVLGIRSDGQKGKSGDEFLEFHEMPGLRIEDLREYNKSFFGKEKPEGLSYTYGERLFGYGKGGLDQIRRSVEKLKAAQHSRRGIAVTWDVEKDIDSDNPPCLTQVTWRLQHGLLHQTAVFRSHDAFGAWPLNAYALRELQKDVAKELSAVPGDLVVVSNSAHVYEGDWAKAENAIGRCHTGKDVVFEPDRKGYFVIRVEDNPDGANGKIIVAQHRLNDGRQSGQEFKGPTANSIYRRILNENLISKLDHAAYVGKELARAEACISSGKEYIQDEA